MTPCPMKWGWMQGSREHARPKTVGRDSRRYGQKWKVFRPTWTKLVACIAENKIGHRHRILGSYTNVLNCCLMAWVGMRLRDGPKIRYTNGRKVHEEMQSRFRPKIGLHFHASSSGSQSLQKYAKFLSPCSVTYRRQAEGMSFRNDEMMQNTVFSLAGRRLLWALTHYIWHLCALAVVPRPRNRQSRYG